MRVQAKLKGIMNFTNWVFSESTFWIVDFNGNSTMSGNISPISAEMIKVLLSEVVSQNKIPELKNRIIFNKTGEMSWLLTGFVKSLVKRNSQVAFLSGQEIFNPFPNDFSNVKTINLADHVNRASSWIPIDQIK